MEPKTKKNGEKEKKLKSKKNGYAQSGESMESVLEKKTKATVGRTCRNGKF